MTPGADRLVGHSVTQLEPFSYVTTTVLPASLTSLSDSVAFVWVERGVVRCEASTDAEPRVVPVRSVVVMWCGVARTWSRGSRPLRVHVVFAPYAWCVAREPALALLRRLQAGEIVVDRTSVDQSAGWMKRWGAPGAITHPRRFRALSCDLEARLLALGDEESDAEGGALESVAQQKARAMALRIEEHFPQSLSLRTLAAAVNLAPGYAANVFRKYRGETPLAYLNRLRIAHARHLLAMTDLKVIEVGNESGFATTSRFYTEFNRTCGMAPAVFRKAARRAAEPSAGLAPVEGARRMAEEALTPLRHVVLWVDDNPNGNFEERKQLFSFGILCDCYVNNESAVAAYRTGRYELVISDIHRPDGMGDGWALLRAVRALDPKAAVIFYTGRIHAEVERTAARRGATGAFDRSVPLITAIVRRLMHSAPVPPVT